PREDEAVGIERRRAAGCQYNVQLVKPENENLNGLASQAPEESLSGPSDNGGPRPSRSSRGRGRGGRRRPQAARATEVISTDAAQDGSDGMAPTNVVVEDPFLAVGEPHA